MTAKDRPERLFRYFGPSDRCFFAEEKLWFSKPIDFNDILEMVGRFDVLANRLADEATQKAWVFSWMYPNIPPNIGFRDFQKQVRAQASTKDIVKHYTEDFPIWTCA